MSRKWGPPRRSAPGWEGRVEPTKEGFLNPYFQRPDNILETREINGQLCVWDDDPEEDFGQLWIPVCRMCLRGPLNKGQQYCHRDKCIVDCPGCRYCRESGWNGEGTEDAR